jgi:outer membrane protein assembly factor BamD
LYPFACVERPIINSLITFAPLKTEMQKFSYLVLLPLVLLLAGCSEYNKVLKSTDIEYKYTKAVEYYKAKECHKALPILEELIGLTRGSSRAEDVYYYYANSHYCVKDYYLANYYFKSFAKTFTNSPKAEECQFNAARCSFELSPGYSLDQADTRNSIDEFQLFLDRYPNSHLRDSANKMITLLNAKLEVKSFENARIFEKTGKYKAASLAFKQFLKDYPATKFKEDVLYLTVKSDYLYAEGSIEEKKLDRYRSTIESYITFANSFPESKKLKEAEGYYKKSQKEVEKLTSGQNIIIIE